MNSLIQYKNSLLLTILLLAFFSGPAFSDDWVPVYLPEIEIPRASGEIKIDGNLDDPGWKSAAYIDRFHEHFPGDQTEPPVDTRVYVTYNDDYFYVAFVCEDDPSTIRATFGERDNVGWDDNVIIAIDTYGDAAWAYELGANVYGIQQDALWSRGGGEDGSFDVIYDSEGKLTGSGYQVEFAIPFSSLRFPAREVQTWKVDFWRNHPRELRRQSSWAAYSRDESCWPCQWGTIKGIEGVSPGRGLELLPSIVASQSGTLSDINNPGSDFVNDDISGEMSLGAKYSITSSLTAEATYNPDFSQIESDVTQIDVNTTFALFYPERRPFFQEGSDLFQTWFTPVYTRSINDPIFAGKMIGRINRTSLAYLTAYDEHSPIIIPFEEASAFLSNGKSVSNIFRARQTFGEESHLGATITDRRYNNGGSGSLLSSDILLKLDKNYQIELQFLATHTEEPEDTSITDGINQVTFDNGAKTAAFDGESFWGHGVYASFERAARVWWFDLDYAEKSPTFRADNGFETSNNSRQVELNTGLDIYPKSKIIANIFPSISVARKWNFARERKDEWFVGSVGMQLPGQTYLDLSYLGSWEKFREVEFPGIKAFLFTLETKFSGYLFMGTSGSIGRRIARNVEPLPVMGDEKNLSVWATIKPTNRLTVNPRIEYVKSDSTGTRGNIFEGYAMRTRFDYQFTREFSLRFITQYNDFNKTWEFDPLLTYRLNSFTVFYLGSTHDVHDYD
ncbi:MAG: hypothetical protein GWN61_25975, partial [candidate division Zixibacteria bacterium]|nr:carbohydrate binding family 9 domain-containing protein [candidate division Zixibacteria bacterium]NIS49307.1 carbohydrate binding family 9 domain-containing protein [candidate division Zixibacteria bacterium]NIU17377.1 carbohydrate binding family 9 domain-containing protein [candidate division Zixibacteria bacterium]NIV09528.1 hypothetical protein [candidate division Zixibacteria bacterium]NIW42385.1 hypothetical protein [candidate division Zixibacteria bacterium]